MDESKYAFRVVPVKTKNGDRRMFESINLALNFCRESEGAKIEFDSIPENLWIMRERERFKSGVYTTLSPGFSERLSNLVRRSLVGVNHYPHLSQDKENVAFTPNHEYGVLDRQIVMNPGRYLKKFYDTYLTGDEIRVLVDDFKMMDDQDYELNIGTTRNDFRFAYEQQFVKAPGSGYVSCMADKFDFTPCHPAEVYAAGDLAIAYLISKKKPTEVLARAVCYPEKNRHSYVYAKSYKFEMIMATKLRKKGFVASSDLSGAKVLRMKVSEDKYVMPYIDGDMRIREISSDPNHFILTREGRCVADSTSGFIYR